MSHPNHPNPNPNDPIFPPFLNPNPPQSPHWAHSTPLPQWYYPLTHPSEQQHAHSRPHPHPHPRSSSTLLLPTLESSSSPPHPPHPSHPMPRPMPHLLPLLLSSSPYRSKQVPRHLATAPLAIPSTLSTSPTRLPGLPSPTLSQPSGSSPLLLSSFPHHPHPHPQNHCRHYSWLVSWPKRCATLLR